MSTLLLVLPLLMACSQRQLPKYPATDDGITRMRLDSAAFFDARHDTRHAMMQLKAAEKRLFTVRTDSLKFLTYYRIAQLNARDGAYRMALDYYGHAARHANDAKRSHRMTDVFLGKASVYNQLGQRDSALWLIGRAEAFKPRIRKDQVQLIDVLRRRVRQHQILTISPEKDIEIVQIQDRYEVALAQREALRQQLLFTYAFIVLLVLAAGIVVWLRYRMRRQIRLYQRRLADTEMTIQAALRKKDSTIEEMKAEIDSRVSELERLRQSVPSRSEPLKNADSIEQTKLGVDTLYTILKGGNLSQMGRREQLAVNAIMASIDYDLSCILNNPRYAFTPKETFYYIMEHEGRSDEEKAAAFCCSAQALRSIKSRLNRKISSR